ncbi:hypothetical protein LIPSTDRAFT_217855 [Lipomyces starkeyi NRRL Y-11557]|uniref:Uncharacterized protein n=1 Tax=Lipomyces starkeyi NRRL Y-11557 TaxID=675824 RepID=A0A1E3QDQ4_LIPST|nr:hypothetical protein LIPSTDRAFT_217855 [Lipomyces starkeyi NRRL Y-11557]
MTDVRLGIRNAGRLLSERGRQSPKPEGAVGCMSGPARTRDVPHGHEDATPKPKGRVPPFFSSPAFCSCDHRYAALSPLTPSAPVSVRGGPVFRDRCRCLGLNAASAARFRPAPECGHEPRRADTTNPFPLLPSQ